MTSPVVAYLGPEGTYAHAVLLQRFSNDVDALPCRDPRHVIDQVINQKAQYGIVPIENSSGSMIFPTLDVLVEERFPSDKLGILEQLAIDVHLSFMMADGVTDVRRVYSHMAAIKHCRDWLGENFPDAELVATSSTADAAQRARDDANGAAIGHLSAAKKYGLNVVHPEILPEVINVTQFFMVGDKAERRPSCMKTCLAIDLKDTVGSLADLLRVFKDAAINLSRIQSRTKPGEPGKYRFLVEIEGDPTLGNVVAALSDVEGLAASIRNLGSYPILDTYTTG